jgi:gas vesicle protein
MIMRDLLDLVSKEKRRKERVKVMKKFVVGMGVVAVLGVATGILFATKFGKRVREDMKIKAINTVETINDTVQNKADEVKDSVANAAEKVCNVIKDVHEKTEGVRKDMKDGFHEITHDIHKTAENISDELNKPVK